ncbi:MAG: response regulator transcription factor [Candidatus Kapaibacterium sp.]
MKKILLIDDSEYIIEGTATVLRFEGYDVRTASSGAKGLELAHAFFPDLVICDVSMPEMDGFEVLRRLRSDTATDAIRFIFLTARADKEDMRMGMARGADDYLLKPFTVEELLAAINAQWKKTENIERKYAKIKTHISYALPHEFRTALNQIIGSARFLDSNRESLESELVPEITTTSSPAPSVCCSSPRTSWSTRSSKPWERIRRQRKRCVPPAATKPSP